MCIYEGYAERGISIALCEVTKKSNLLFAPKDVHSSILKTTTAPTKHGGGQETSGCIQMHTNERQILPHYSSKHTFSVQAQQKTQQIAG